VVGDVKEGEVGDIAQLLGVSLGLYRDVGID
jgi:hypothetical protein